MGEIAKYDRYKDPSGAELEKGHPLKKGKCWVVKPEILETLKDQPKIPNEWEYILEQPKKNALTSVTDSPSTNNPLGIGASPSIQLANGCDTPKSSPAVSRKRTASIAAADSQGSTPVKRANVKDPKQPTMDIAKFISVRKKKKEGENEEEAGKKSDSSPKENGNESSSNEKESSEKVENKNE